MKYLFTCGGTAGHINPALAVASQLKSLLPSCEILFIGADGQMETELVPREGYEIRTVTITNISRGHSIDDVKHNAETVKNVLVSSAKARKIIREFAPDAVIGTGGYVCFPVLSAAHELHIPTLLHESNASPGLTTRLLSRTVDRIIVGYESSIANYPEPSKVKAAGTPVRLEFSEFSKESAKSGLGVDVSEPLVLSVWGSLGAAHMNGIMLDMIRHICRDGVSPRFHLIHATGKRYYTEFMDAINKDCPDYPEHGIEIREYINDMPKVMTASDVVLCRAGASTLSELTYMGKPSVLVPSPNVTENHQEKNARAIEKAGGAIVFLENEFDAVSLLQKIQALIADENGLKKMSDCAAKLSVRNSAQVIAEEIISLAQNHAAMIK